MLMRRDFPNKVGGSYKITLPYQPISNILFYLPFSVLDIKEICWTQYRVTILIKMVIFFK